MSTGSEHLPEHASADAGSAEVPAASEQRAAETLAQRDLRIGAWLDQIKPGDIVTVRLNDTDTLTGKVYEAPDARGTSLCVWTTILRHGNGYPGASYEPVDRAAAEDHGLRAVLAAIEALYPPYNYELRYDGTEDPTAAAYVEAFREIDAALEPFRAAIGDDGRGGDRGAE